MDVQAPEPGEAQHALGEDLPVGRDDEDVRAGLSRRANAASSFSVGGWKTCIPSDFASQATGGSVISALRPTGFPGCETTRTTSWPAAPSFSSVGTAKDGEPKKTMRTLRVYRHETRFSL